MAEDKTKQGSPCPTKITATDLKSDANEVAVDTLEVAHESLTITTASG